MTQFKTDENNDLYLDDSGDLATVDGEYDLIQTISSSLKLWLGEYEYDTTVGVMYNQIYSNPHLLPEFIDYNIKIAIMSPNDFLTADNLALYGVKNINSLDYNLDRSTRVMTVTAEILLNNGNNNTIEVQL